MVVDLAVNDGDRARGLAVQRLGTTRQIDDAQSAMRQGDTLTLEPPCAIRPPMAKRTLDATHRGQRLLRETVRMECACNAAHSADPPSTRRRKGARARHHFFHTTWFT